MFTDNLPLVRSVWMDADAGCTADPLRRLTPFLIGLKLLNACKSSADPFAILFH